MLDAVFASEDAGNAMGEELGAIVEGSAATFKLWAPTAQDHRTRPIQRRSAKFTSVLNDGKNAGQIIWATDAVSNAVNNYYRYQVKVYHPTTGNIETRLVTDTYSLRLSKNSAYLQVIDLNDAALMPEGWVGYKRPTVEKDERSRTLRITPSWF